MGCGWAAEARLRAALWTAVAIATAFVLVDTTRVLQSAMGADFRQGEYLERKAAASRPQSKAVAFAAAVRGAARKRT